MLTQTVSMRLLRSYFSTIAATLAACSPASAEPVFTGIGRPIDGDSLYVGEREVRLFGIDAPEYHQTCTRNGRPWSCGADAAKELSSLATGKLLRCVPIDTDEHGRTVARCSVGSLDINRLMVATGYAVAYRHYSLDYVSAEDSAKANRRGLWAGNFQLPSDYRHEEAPVTKRAPRQQTAHRRNETQPSRSTATNSSCNIKGNRGPHGWIYHLPGMPYYNQTHAEQMFCTEAEARAAGYRRAKVR
jgi:endonuclease YncB( thermonuclease family)